MKNSKAERKSVFIIGNIITLVMAIIALYGFLQSADKGAEGISTLAILSLFTEWNCSLGKVSQRRALTAAGFTAAIAAVTVIANVGIWILNIRYIGLVYAVFTAALSAAQLVLFTAENRKSGN